MVEHLLRMHKLGRVCVTPNTGNKTNQGTEGRKRTHKSKEIPIIAESVSKALKKMQQNNSPHVNP